MWATGRLPTLLPQDSLEMRLYVSGFDFNESYNATEIALLTLIFKTISMIFPLFHQADPRPLSSPEKSPWKCKALSSVLPR